MQNLESTSGSTSAFGIVKTFLFLINRYHRIMISKVKPLHKKVEETTQAIDNAEHKMNVLENKRKVFAKLNISYYLTILRVTALE